MRQRHARNDRLVRSFNPRICKRCDLTYNDEHLPKNVSIHASVKDATIKTTLNDFFIGVSIHASVKDATEKWAKAYAHVCVSIHASVKDATGYYIDTFFDMDVSIHASVKDATQDLFFCHHISFCFNPRICKRCDSLPEPVTQSTTGFNPRICKRCD